MNRKRRIILNDDFQPVFNEKTPEDLLDQRFRQAVGTQVDTYIYYVGDGWHPHRGRIPDAGLGDPHAVMVEAAHREGIEIFASLRMNDIHCAYDGSFGPLQRERPDLLIGAEFLRKDADLMDILQHNVPPSTRKEDAPFYEPGMGLKSGLMSAFWCVFNYAMPEVREFRRKRVEEVAGKYDFDGFELDFCRAALFFKPGEEREHAGAMTDLIRQVRNTLDAIAAERGRPYLLAVKVAETPERALRTGLDVPAWLEERLIDMVMVGGTESPFLPAIQEFVDLAHRHGVPAYPSVDIDGYDHTPHDYALDGHANPFQVRALASNWMAMGADGIYLFNWYGLPPDAPEQLALLHQIGDEETLKYTNKRFQPDNGTSNGAAGYSNAPRQFPVKLLHGTPVELMIGDDVRQAAAEGKLDSLELRIEAANVHIDEGIDIVVNGIPVPRADVRRTSEGEFKASLDASMLRQGVNRIAALPGRGSAGRLSSEIAWVDLSVHYVGEPRETPGITRNYWSKY